MRYGHPQEKGRRSLMTRADEIRSMTDEEMARWLYPLVAGTEAIDFCPGCEACGELLDEGFIPEEDCIGCLTAYLRRQVPEK